MKFSQRIGQVPPTKQLQINSMDEDLRNGLWNAMQIYVLNKLPKYGSTPSAKSQFKFFCEVIWHTFYKLPIDTIADNVYSDQQFIRERFYASPWYGVYDFLEFVATLHHSFEINSESFKKFCNGVLETEFSGYRFVDDKISPITNENEIAAIEEAIQQTGHFSAFKGANIHLRSALDKLSDKNSPDYRNSIKESISAIEALAKAISNSEKDSLGSALAKIKGQIKLHPALEKGFKQLYGYTSDSDGIRHALMENPNCDFEDAKYMMVSISAFINYLIIKAQKAGINFN